MRRVAYLLGVGAWLACSLAAAGERTVNSLPFKVRKQRPRIWIRKDNWDGPSIPKLKKWFKLPEYKKRGGPGDRALQYVVTGNQAAGEAAVARILKERVSGKSPSYQGRSAQVLAAHYDWLRNHPAFTEEKRKQVVAYLEQWGDRFTKYVSGRGAPMYYSRYPGAVGGLCVIGLALHGDSPKAEGYCRVGYAKMLEYGKARQYEDGASSGGSYSHYHAFPDLARAVCAYESATDAGLVKYIKEKQGNWLERQLLWQIWSTYPTGYFVKEGDLWQNPDSKQVRPQIDIVTHLTKNPYGRAHADLMYKRHGRNDYHRNYVWQFYLFNNPEIKPKPLSGLGRAELFGRDCHGYVIFRDGWGVGNTHILFRCGEGLDVHSNRGAGSIDIYRHRTLAQRANKDYPKDGRDDRIQFCNAMVFNDHDHKKTEMKTDIPLDFAGFLARKKRRNVELASILDYEVKKEYARVKGDISAAVRKDCKKWTRELVYLGYKYLLVLDRVETQDIPVVQRWQMHFPGETKVEGKLAVTTLSGGRLFCKTLLPENAKVVGEKVGKWNRHAVEIKTEKAAKSVFLHVLYPTEATTAKMPACSVTEKSGALTVKVGDLTYTFKAAK
jgi:hypothetical protein